MEGNSFAVYFMLITYNYGGMVKLIGVHGVHGVSGVHGVVMENEVTTRFTFAYEGLFIYLL
jgi:hypothetical protein